MKIETDETTFWMVFGSILVIATCIMVVNGCNNSTKETTLALEKGYNQVQDHGGDKDTTHWSKP